MKIFFGDLVHDWEKVSLWTFPLNVGYIASYAQKYFDEPLEVKIFKRPQQMIDAIKREKPDVVGLAYYVWNSNLNQHVFDVTKQYSPSTLTVAGGPNFTTANANNEHALEFFSETPTCDAYVINQGEKGFLELLRRFRESNTDLKRFRSAPIDGCLINDLAASQHIHLGKELDIIRELDEIPSPYQSGLLDPFFEEPFVPLLETNRSCPYRCTFCAWGIGTGKLARFSDERVFGDIEYISSRCHKSANIFIVDANFSILERDVEIAQHLKNCHEKYGFPGHVGCQWNKSRPDRVLRVARELGDLGEVGASMQSLDGDVLGAIKRRNLNLEDVKGMVDTLRTEGINMSLFSELILGLPNETAESHLDANRILMDIGAEVFNYNLHLLPGTEMDSQESREKYVTKTGWRLHDNAYGIYENKKIFEGQEVVLGTNAMSTEELLNFRFIHFLIQFMWGRRWYYDYLKLFNNVGLHPIDMVLKIADAFQTDDGDMGELYKRFRADHALENFVNFDELIEYWSKADNFERLKNGTYGKLNYLYSFEILLNKFSEFNEFLENIADSVLAEISADDTEVILDQCQEILSFSYERRIALTQDGDSLVANKRKSFQYDLLSWRENGYKGLPSRISTSDRYEFEFFLSKRQQNVLKKQFEQFRSHNLNLTLRKMSEEINAEEFFTKLECRTHPKNGLTEPSS